MGCQCPVALAVVLCAGRLFVLSGAHRTLSPRIISPPLGEKRFSFVTADNHAVLYHEEGTSSVLLGAVNNLYYYDFETSVNHRESFLSEEPSQCEKPEDSKNYLTLLEKSEDKMLICGSYFCKPTCWNWTRQGRSEEMDGRGLAPFALRFKGIVLREGYNVYSSVKPRWLNGNTPRFRRIRGPPHPLYSSDLALLAPELIKGIIVKREEAINDKIYLFVNEDNKEWLKNPTLPRRLPRVGQLCKYDGGGMGSISGAKWSTLLKSTLLCNDAATGRHFNRLKDVFIVESSDWRETKIYGLFLNEWDYSAVCVYSMGVIAKNFDTSPLRGYSGSRPSVRPGECINDSTPYDTFKVIDSYPDVTHNVKYQSMFFHSKHHYQKLVAHKVLAADGIPYDVFYLATDKGTIHKVVALKDGAMNIMEIEPFQQPAIITSMILDNVTNELFVSSTTEVVQLPLAMCGIYKDNCASCVLARDPYCGWSNGKCTSVYKKGALLQALTHNVSPDVCASENSTEGSGDQLETVAVRPQSRYYLNCTIESHHANYTWLHNNQIVAHCAGGRPKCVYFIDKMTDDLCGDYSCVSQENWLRQIHLARRLTMSTAAVKLPQISTESPYNWATKPSSSSWLGLCLGAIILLSR